MKRDFLVKEQKTKELKDFDYQIGRTQRDDKDLQRYITERVYADSNSRNIVGKTENCV